MSFLSSPPRPNEEEKMENKLLFGQFTRETTILSFHQKKVNKIEGRGGELKKNELLIGIEGNIRGM